MPMARCSVSLLSSHGRGIGPQDALKKDSRSFSDCGRKTLIPSTSAGDLRELLRVPLRIQASCGVGQALSGVPGFGGMEVGHISS